MGSPELIAAIIQGGAIGILMMALYGGYKLARQLMADVKELVGNHLTHLTEEVSEGKELMRDVAADIKRIADRV